MTRDLRKAPPISGTGAAPESLDVLTALRFFAAALVVIFHCAQPALALQSPQWTQRLALNGYQAVSFFFALSGFILTYSYFDTKSSSGSRCDNTSFWIARFARIYPIYALGLLIAAVPFAITSMAPSQDNHAWVVVSLLSVPVLVQAWLPQVAVSWNVPAWSLSVEAFFYLLFPLLLRASLSLSPRLFLILSLGISTALQLARFWLLPLPEAGAAFHGSLSVHDFYAYFPLFHLSTFVFGMALGRVHLSRRQGANRWSSAVFVFMLLVVALVFSLHGVVHPLLLSDAMLVPLYGVLIQAAPHVSGMVRSFLSHRILETLGRASYATYLLHWPLWFWAKALAGRLGLGSQQSMPWFFATYFCITIAASLVALRYVEEPMREWLRKYLTEFFRKTSVPRAVSP